MVRVALLSNPRSTGNRSYLPKIRSFCAEHSEIFHYEVERVDQIGEALRTIAQIKPKVLVINGGDGTVQAALTELYNDPAYFGDQPPPVAVLPNGKTNLIALDLGAQGDPLEALKRIVDLVQQDISGHVVAREMIALSNEGSNARPVLGMFLGGAGLADSMLYCRNKIYPLGLPNGLSHFLTLMALLLSLLFGVRAAFLPPRPSPVKISLLRDGQLQGRFAIMIVTTLQKLLLGLRPDPKAGGAGSLHLVLVEQSPAALVRAFLASLSGRFTSSMRGVHMQRGDKILIESDRSSVILDGELFEAKKDSPILLTPTAPVPFLSLAA